MAEVEKEITTTYQVYCGYDLLGSYPSLKEAREHFHRADPDYFDAVFIVKTYKEILTITDSDTIQSKSL